jgi:hypothetical protein
MAIIHPGPATVSREYSSPPKKLKSAGYTSNPSPAGDERFVKVLSRKRDNPHSGIVQLSPKFARWRKRAKVKSLS